MENELLRHLRGKLSHKRDWISRRYNYYNQKHLLPDPSKVIPTADKYAYHSTLDWCTRAVDDLANRLIFDGFENDEYGMWDIFKQNNKDIFFDSAIRSALISACCFIYISNDENNFPRLQVIDGANATGIIDPITNMLKAGYAILDTDDIGAILTEALFTADETVIFTYDGKGNLTGQSSIPNPAGYPLLVPVIYRPDARRPFGQSRISRTMMDLMNKARFTITRAEVCGEFSSIPQKYILGLSEDAEFDTLKNTYKSFLAIDKDSDGQSPTIGQFAQASVQPHVEQFQMYKEEFDRAASLDSTEALETVALKAQDTFGYGFLNVGLTAICLKDQMKYNRSALADCNPLWKPVYRIDNAAINTFGDGIIKLNQAIPGAIDAKAVSKLTGLPISEEA